MSEQYFLDPEPDVPHEDAFVAKLVLGIVVGLSVCVLGVAVLVAWVSRERMERLPPRAAENSAEKFDKAAEVFSSDNAPADEATHEEFTALMERMRVAFDTQNAAALARLFDVRRMLQEAIRLESFNFSQSQLQQLTAATEKNLSQRLIEQADFFTFVRFELKRVEFNADADEAVLYVRQWDADNYASKMRWWVIRTESGWRFYDYEELSTSLRFSNLAAAGMLLAMKNPSKTAVFERELQSFNNAVRATIDEDFESARQELDRLQTSTTLARPMKAVVHMLLATVAIAEGDAQTGLAECDTAEAFHPDLLVLTYLRSIALNHLERYEEARQHAQAFLDKLGSDADASAELATALQGLGRDEEALAAMREGLDDDPSAAGLLVMLGIALPEDNKQELGERFARLPQPSEQFEAVCEQFLSDANALEALVKAYRPLAPEDPDLAYYQAQLHVLREEPGLAVDVLQPVIPTVKDRDDFTYFEQLYYQAVVDANVWQEIYTAAEDKPHVFTLMADVLWEYEDPEPLKELVTFHQEHAPDDPQLHGYVGEVAEREGDWPRAIDAYRQAMEHEPEEGWQETLVYAMFHGDRAMEALKTCEPTDDVFRQLMRLADYEDPRPILLIEELVREYTATHPENVAGTFWQARLAYLHEDFTRAVELLREHADAINADEELQWRFDELLVYSLVRLKRFDEARIESLRIYHDDEDPFPAAVVEAARGNVEDTALWLERCTDAHYYSSDDFHFDEILGPILRSDAFKSLHDQYPPPITETGA